MTESDPPIEIAAGNTVETSVLIVGAGPFGLSLGAYLSDLGVDHILAGEPMSFWRRHMPKGMLLRSGLDWHLDVRNEVTLEAFAREQGWAGEDALPLSRDRYLEYADWFSRRKGLQPSPLHVRSLDLQPDGRFLAGCGDTAVLARAVVVATGFGDHASPPDDVFRSLPPGLSGHTCDVVALDALAGRSVLIVGGRQSAFEWTALLVEAGARSVDLVYRHDTPRFEPSDWTWVDALMERTEREPGWYRALDPAERDKLNARFWSEGRLKLEPWLAARVDAPNVRTWPRDRVTAIEARDSGFTARLESGQALEADFLLLATGYKVDITHIGFLSPALLDRIETRDGFPVLGTALESSVPGLYFTSIAATRDFGPFFAFTVSCRCSARLIGDSVASRLATFKA